MANRNYAANQSKLQRAISKATEEAKRTGAEVNEARIKELYVSFGGLLNEEVDGDSEEEARGSAEGEESRPRPRSRRSSKDEE